jgi:ABC-2 type transport system permease protein
MASLTAGLDNAALIKKVPVPTAIFPFAAAGTQLLVIGLQSVVLLAGSVLVGALSLTVLLFPVALLIQTALALGIGMLVGAFVPAVRDLRIAMESVLLLVFYATPILYDSRLLPENVRRIVQLNPLDGVMQLHRASWLGLPVDGFAVLVSAVSAAVLLVMGHLVYRRRSRLFADLV